MKNCRAYCSEQGEANNLSFADVSIFCVALKKLALHPGGIMNFAVFSIDLT